MLDALQDSFPNLPSVAVVSTIVAALALLAGAMGFGISTFVLDTAELAKETGSEFPLVWLKNDRFANFFVLFSFPAYLVLLYLVFNTKLIFSSN